MVEVNIERVLLGNVLGYCCVPKSTRGIKRSQHFLALAFAFAFAHTPQVAEKKSSEGGKLPSIITSWKMFALARFHLPKKQAGGRRSK